MATIGEIEKTLAEVTGVKSRSIREISMRLADAGLRTASGRGASAKDVPAEDLARMLIAVMSYADRIDHSNVASVTEATRDVSDMISNTDTAYFPKPDGGWAVQTAGYRDNKALSPLASVARLLRSLNEGPEYGVHALELHFHGGVIHCIAHCVGHGEFDGGILPNINRGRRYPLACTGIPEQKTLHRMIAIDRPQLEKLADHIAPAKQDNSEPSLPFEAPSKGTNGTRSKRNGSPVAASEPLHSGAMRAPDQYDMPADPSREREEVQRLDQGLTPDLGASHPLSVSIEDLKGKPRWPKRSPSPSSRAA